MRIRTGYFMENLHSYKVMTKCGKLSLFFSMALFSIAMTAPELSHSFARIVTLIL